MPATTPTPPDDPARFPPTAYYRTVAQVIAIVRATASLWEDLLTFATLPKWTVALFATRWGISAATAERALRRLYRLGLVAVLRGGGRRTKGAHHGGRLPHVWYLTPLGSRTLLALHPGTRIARPPVLGQGQPVRDARNNWSYTRATEQARALAVHDLRCVAAAIHQGAFAQGTHWHLRWRIAWTGTDGTTGHLIADMGYDQQREVWEPLRGPGGRAVQRRLLVFEIEGSEEAAHIFGKHARYDAAWHALQRKYVKDSTDILLVIVLAFTSAKVRQSVRKRHIAAYARLPEKSYTLAFLDLATLLAAPPGTIPAAAVEAIDYYRVSAPYRLARARGTYRG